MPEATVARRVLVPREVLEEYLILKAAIAQGYGTPKMRARVEKLREQIGR